MTTTVLNRKTKASENKIPDVSGLVKKTDCDAKILDIEEDTLPVLIIINTWYKDKRQRISW